MQATKGKTTEKMWRGVGGRKDYQTYKPLWLQRKEREGEVKGKVKKEGREGGKVEGRKEGN